LAMEPATAARAFLSAARFAGEAIRGPVVGTSWDEPSALQLMTVGDVVGHVFLIVRRVGKRLDGSFEGSAAGVGVGVGVGPMVYPRVERPEDLDDEIHEQVRLDARRVAQWGWPDVCQAYADRLARLECRMADPIPDSVPFGDRRVAIGEYLGSRVVEILVHVDDLAASIGKPVGTPPEDAVELALVHLLGAARQVHGDLAVLRAFTRRERVPASAPSIF
jgi:hypothetical protein